MNKKDNTESIAYGESHEEILALYQIRNCLRSIFSDGTKNEFVVDEAICLYEYVNEAAEILIRYDTIDDDDIKFDLGMEYSEIIADIEDMMDSINQKGISLYIH